MSESTRSAGVLLHITCLPARHGIGDLGPSADRFIDRLAAAGLSYWQVLPLHPTELRLGSSPYHSPSAFAGNVQLISPELLIESEYLSKRDLVNLPEFSVRRIDFASVFSWKQRLFQLAFERMQRGRTPPGFEAFCQEQEAWLEDYALFEAIKTQYRRSSWQGWPEPLRDRNSAALNRIRRECGGAILKTKFLQFLFFEQWARLRSYARRRGVHLIGDLPIYVTYESADVWRDPDIFQLDGKKRPTHVAGVPPDYFSATGQLWGNPLYRWEVLADRDYSWWMARFRHALSLFDLVRIDHFRGFVGYWKVPAGHKTARRGRWVSAPADDFFNRLQRSFPGLPFIAEDLGTITPDVIAVMQRYDLPGMRVLLFAFGGDDPHHPYLPSNYPRRCVACTGTHDTNTVRGWFEKEAGEDVRERVFRYLQRDVKAHEVAWEFIRRVMDSRADLAVFPLQDFLNLGQQARMNRPGHSRGNWMWRMKPDAFSDSLVHRIAQALRDTSRA